MIPIESINITYNYPMVTMKAYLKIKHLWNCFFIRLFKAHILFLMPLPLSGCVFLLFTGPITLPGEISICPRAQVYTIRGIFDVLSTGMFSLKDKITKETNFSVKSLSYVETKRLGKLLIHEYPKNHCKPPIIFIGHSFGADEALVLAQTLNKAQIPVALIISLDHTKPQTIPPNVDAFYNINSGKSLLSGLVPWGCSMHVQSKKTRMYQVDLGKDLGFHAIHHFNIDKRQDVQDYILKIIRAETKTEGLKGFWETARFLKYDA